MTIYKGAVYSTTAPGFPHLAIVLDESGAIVASDTVESVEEGEALLEAMQRQVAEDAKAGKI